MSIKRCALFISRLFLNRVNKKVLYAIFILNLDKDMWSICLRMKHALTYLQHIKCDVNYTGLNNEKKTKQSRKIL